MTNENPALARAFQVYARAFGYFSAIFWANILQTETCIAVKDNIVAIFWANSVFLEMHHWLEVALPSLYSFILLR